jgi:hypothetical protein
MRIADCGILDETGERLNLKLPRGFFIDPEQSLWVTRSTGSGQA